MKEFIKNAKTGLTIGVFASIVIIISLLIYTKARQSSSSGVTVDSGNPASLYVGAGETLTSAKRNRLVQKANREEVATSDTALFDTNCERKRDVGGEIWIPVYITSSSIQRSGTSTWWVVSNTNKSKVTGSTTYTVNHIRKKCP